MPSRKASTSAATSNSTKAAGSVPPTDPHPPAWAAWVSMTWE